MKGHELVFSQRDATEFLTTHFPLGAKEGGWIPPLDGEKLEIVFDYGDHGGRGFVELSVGFVQEDEGIPFLNHLEQQGYLDLLTRGGEALKVSFLFGARPAKERLEESLRAGWWGVDGEVLENFEAVFVDA